MHGIQPFFQGGRPVQDAFHRVLCPPQTSTAIGGPWEDGVHAPEIPSTKIRGNDTRGGAAAVFFGALRDRMVRAERALPAFQALFWERARELGLACAQREKAPTVTGVEAVCARGRAGRMLAGSHAREVMLLLQQLCEGHNYQMQEFLRQQGPGSVDLISQVPATLLNCFVAAPQSPNMTSKCKDRARRKARLLKQLRLHTCCLHIAALKTENTAVKVI